ncbi:MAG: hypothetical protein IJ176_09335 [Prevotella sp.]|nr:hypothetical protein [Prevotella sp.]
MELDGTLTLKDCSEGKTDLSTRPRKPRLRQTDLSKRFRTMQPVMQKYKIDPDGGGNNTDD